MIKYDRGRIWEDVRGVFPQINMAPNIVLIQSTRKCLIKRANENINSLINSRISLMGSVVVFVLIDDYCISGFHRRTDTESAGRRRRDAGEERSNCSECQMTCCHAFFL